MAKPVRLCLLIITCILAMSMQGCGFQFRGNNAYSSQLSSVQITGRLKDSEQGRVIERLAERYGMEVSNDALWALDLEKETLDRMRVTATRMASTDEFLLTRTIVFSLVHKHAVDSEVYGPVTVTRQATYQDDQAQVLSKSNEEQIIRQELMESVAEQILRQADRIAANPPNCSINHENSGTHAKHSAK